MMCLVLVLGIHREMPEQFSEFSLHSTSQTSNILGPVLGSLLPARLSSCRALAGAVRAAWGPEICHGVTD